MMRAPALALAALLPLAAAAQPLPSPEVLYQQLSPSVWLVRALDADGVMFASGSAVVTGPETLLTNCHVLRNAKRIVVAHDNVAHGAQLQHIDVKRDLCQLTARNLRAPAVELGDSEQLAVGQKVFALGNPQGFERTLSDGLVSSLHRSDDQKRVVMIQTSAPISQGSSGGGLFDARGRLVGITTLIHKTGQNLNFAIPINWVHELAARSDAALKAAPAPVAKAPSPTAGKTADVNDVEAVPVNAQCREEYRKYLQMNATKAFAVADQGKCAWAAGRVSPRPQITNASDPAVRSMELCVHWHGTGCKLYAVDGRVVYQR